MALNRFIKVISLTICIATIMKTRTESTAIEASSPSTETDRSNMVTQSLSDNTGSKPIDTNVTTNQSHVNNTGSNKVDTNVTTTQSQINNTGSNKGDTNVTTQTPPFNNTDLSNTTIPNTSSYNTKNKEQNSTTTTNDSLIHTTSSRNVFTSTEAITESTTKKSAIEGRDIHFNFVIVIDGKFNQNLSDRSSDLFHNYSHYFKSVLSTQYEKVPGFLRIEIKQFTKGSIHLDYKVIIAGSVIKTKETAVSQHLQNATTSITSDVEIPPYIGTLNDTETQTINNENIKQMIAKFNKPCLGVCNRERKCYIDECVLKCNFVNCKNGGTCVLSQSFDAKCVCKPLFTGTMCEKHNSDVVAYSEKLFMIEVMGGAGGGVILSLIIVLIIVCIRRGSPKERDDVLTENEPTSGRENNRLNGKNNPIYEKDNYNFRNSMESNESLAQDKFITEGRENLSNSTYDGRYDRRFEHQIELDNRKMVQRQDGRMYQVIEDDNIGNNTFLYQPSFKQPMRGNRSPTTDVDAYEYHSTHSSSIYDQIDTGKDYRILRPNLASKRSYYN